MDIDTKEIFYDKLTYVQIHIPLFDKKENELETFEDKWFYVIQNLQKFKNRPEALQERIFDKLFKTAELAKFDKKQRMAYEDSLKYYRDIRNVENTSEERGEQNKLIEIIKNGIEEGFSIDSISKITKLSLEEIQEIANSFNK